MYFNNCPLLLSPCFSKSFKEQQKQTEQNTVKLISSVLILLLSVLICINHFHHYQGFSKTSCLHFAPTNLESSAKVAAEGIWNPHLDSLIALCKVFCILWIHLENLCVSPVNQAARRASSSGAFIVKVRLRNLFQIHVEFTSYSREDSRERQSWTASSGRPRKEAVFAGALGTLPSSLQARGRAATVVQSWPAHHPQFFFQSWAPWPCHPSSFCLMSCSLHVSPDFPTVTVGDNDSEGRMGRGFHKLVIQTEFWYFYL